MKQYLRRLDRAYKRVLARSLLPIATLPARFMLRRGPALRILVDNTVLGHGITHETGWITTGTKLWGGNRLEAVATLRLLQLVADVEHGDIRDANVVEQVATILKAMCSERDLRKPMVWPDPVEAVNAYYAARAIDPNATLRGTKKSRTRKRRARPC